MAQLVERFLAKEKVAGSTPVSRSCFLSKDNTIPYFQNKFNFFLLSS